MNKEVGLKIRTKTEARKSNTGWVIIQNYNRCLGYYSKLKQLFGLLFETINNDFCFFQKIKTLTDTSELTEDAVFTATVEHR